MAESFLTRMMAARCEHCPLCRWARANPEKPVARLVHWHGRFCPFWRAHEKVYGKGTAAGAPEAPAPGGPAA